MTLNHSIVLNESGVIPRTLILSANKSVFGECCNITKLETSWSAWHFTIVWMGSLTRYSVAVF